jgi:drug/metabolite transporter (DMT)-like permease
MISAESRVLQMGLGNIIALFFQFPFFVIVAILLGMPPDYPGRLRGFLLVGMLFGGIAWVISFLYLSVSNAKILQAYIDSSPVISSILRFMSLHEKRIRLLFYVFIFLMIVLELLAPRPKMRPSPTMSAQGATLSLYR